MAKNSRMSKVLEGCSVVLIVAMFGTVALQVYARYFMEVAPAWTEEVGRYLLIWLTAVGAGLALRASDGYRGAVDFVINAMPPRYRHALNLTFMATVLAFLCVLAVKTFGLVLGKMEVRTPALELPVSYLYLGVLFMAILMVWGLSSHIRKEVRSLAAGDHNEASDDPGEPSVRNRDSGGGEA